MSIEATTYEQINVKNNNEQTKAVAEKIGEYMLETWGILNLKMTVDGKAFETDEESITSFTRFVRTSIPQRTSKSVCGLATQAAWHGEKNLLLCRC